MRKISIVITAILFIFLYAGHADALTPTPSPRSAPSQNDIKEKLNEQINQLKEKIASRVSELNLVEKRGIIGVVSTVSGNQITLTDVAGKTRQVDVDEITKFSSPDSKSFGLSDLTKGTKVSILGLYNKQSKRILARFIDTAVNPTYLSGAISDLSSTDFTVTITSDDQKQSKIDIETITKISTYGKDSGITRYGFSKLKVGDRVTAVGFPSKKDPNILVPNRILVFPNLPKNPKIVVSGESPTGSETITPSTGSGKKLTPIR